MVPSIILGAAIVLPALLILLLRVEAALIFLSLCAGLVLTEFMGENAVLAASTFNGDIDEKYVLMVLLLLPPVLMTIALRKTVPSSKLAFNILPAIAVGLAGVILVYGFLPPSAQNQLKAGDFWPSVNAAKDLIMGGGILVALVALWITHRQPKDKGTSKGKKHH